MVYLRAVIVGIVAAVVAVLLWIVVSLFVGSSIATTGSGGIGAVGAGGFGFVLNVTSALVVALIGVVLGGGWYLRRTRRVTASRVDLSKEA